MADHRAFGLACGAGGIDQNGRVFGCVASIEASKRCGLAASYAAPIFIKLVQKHDLRIGKPMQAFALDHDDLGQAGHLVADLQELVQLLVVLDDQETGCPNC